MNHLLYGYEPVEPEYENCPDCNGDGGVWIDENGKEYSIIDYKCMNEEERKELEFDKCERCDGEGVVEVEPYEPDWEDYDD